jgi:hypothetical protein
VTLKEEFVVSLRETQPLATEEEVEALASMMAQGATFSEAARFLVRTGKIAAVKGL